MTIHSVPALMLLIGGGVGAFWNAMAGFICIGVAGLLMLLGV